MLAFFSDTGKLGCHLGVALDLLDVRHWCWKAASVAPVYTDVEDACHES